MPAERFLAEEQLDDKEGAWVHALATSHRSLFEVQKVHEGIILLDDLLGGGAFAVTERRRLPGVEDNEIFEARLVANVVTPPELLFTRAFQFHPREARGELKRQAERARKAGEARAETLFRLLAAASQGAALQARHRRQDLQGRMSARSLAVARRDAVAASAAHAQSASTGVAVERFVPALGPTALVGVEGAAVTPAGRGIVGGVASTSSAIRSRCGRRYTGARVSRAGALTRSSATWRSSSACGSGWRSPSACRWSLYQDGDRLRGTGTSERALATTVAGDIRIRAKASLVEGKRHGRARSLLQVTAPGGGAVRLRRDRRRHRRAAAGRRRASRAA